MKTLQKSEVVEYHQSSLGMFLKCQMQYYFRYIQGLVVPPKSALTIGRSVDTGVTVNFTQKVETKQDLPVSDVIDAYSTEFDKCSPGTDWDGDDAGKAKDQGVDLLKLHHKVVAPKIQPVTVQETFRIGTDGGYAIGGTMDLTDQNGFIRDTKTAKAKYADNAVEMSNQAAMYDFAYETKHGKKAAGFAFDVLKKTKTPDYQEVVGQVSEFQRELLFRNINIMHKQLATGDFLTAPEGAWWCSKNWCGYWSMCKGKKS